MPLPLPQSAPIPAALTIDGLRFARGGRPVAAVDRLAVMAGEALLVLGPSGSGKSTLLHLIAGLLTPAAGHITIDGTDIAALDDGARDRFRGRSIGIVFQVPHLIAALTVTQNLALARSLAGLGRDAAGAQALLERLGIAAKADAKPRTLSGGEAQRAAIARALVTGPKLLLADEPTSHLDDAHAAGVADLLIGAARGQGAALVIATHDARLLQRGLPVLRLEATP